jgi:hypothetical protein
MAGRFGKYGDAKRKAHLRRKGKTGNTIPKTREDRRQCSPKKKIKDQEENRMEARSGITVKERKRLDRLFQDKGYADYKWIDPHKIIVSQWVRMKCMFGCGEYGNNMCHPFPNVNGFFTNIRMPSFSDLKKQSPSPKTATSGQKR